MTGTGLRGRSSAQKSGEDLWGLGDDLDFAFGHVSEKNRLEVHIQGLKTDGGVLPAILGGPIRSALAGEGWGPLMRREGRAPAPRILSSAWRASFSSVIGNAVSW